VIFNLVAHQTLLNFSTERKKFKKVVAFQSKISYNRQAGDIQYGVVVNNEILKDFYNNEKKE